MTSNGETFNQYFFLAWFQKICVEEQLVKFKNYLSLGMGPTSYPIARNRLQQRLNNEDRDVAKDREHWSTYIPKHSMLLSESDLSTWYLTLKSTNRDQFVRFFSVTIHQELVRSALNIAQSFLSHNDITDLIIREPFVSHKCLIKDVDDRASPPRRGRSANINEVFGFRGVCNPQSDFGFKDVDTRPPLRPHGIPGSSHERQQTETSCRSSSSVASSDAILVVTLYEDEGFAQTSGRELVDGEQEGEQDQLVLDDGEEEMNRASNGRKKKPKSKGKAKSKPSLTHSPIEDPPLPKLPKGERWVFTETRVYLDRGNLLQVSHGSLSLMDKEEKDFQSKLLKQLWARQFPNGLILKKVKGKGVCVFTNTRINQTRIIGRYLGKVMSEAIYQRRFDQEDRFEESHYGFQLGHIVIDAKSYGNITRYIAHSCNPNCLVKALIDDDKQLLLVYTTRTIKAGEEITISYGKGYGGKCLCKEPNCTGVIGKQLPVGSTTSVPQKGKLTQSGLALPPVFTPTEAEMKDFESFITNKTHTSGLEHGFALIKPPKNWAPEYGEDKDEYLSLINKPKIQTFSKIGKGNLYFVEQSEEANPCSIQEFIDQNDNSQISVEAFWKRLKTGQFKPRPRYMAGTNWSMFDSNSTEFNPGNLTTGLNIVGSIPGLNSPYMYEGRAGSVFCLHTEDMNLYSINYLHSGASKIWYVIPESQGKAVETLLIHENSKLEGKKKEDCPVFFRHKTLLVSPEFLVAEGIKFYMVVQKKGYFMVTYPGALHQGFNSGQNSAEASNFTTKFWAPFGIDYNRNGSCKCNPEAIKFSSKNIKEIKRHYQHKEDVEQIKRKRCKHS